MSDFKQVMAEFSAWLIQKYKEPGNFIRKLAVAMKKAK